ncbi:MAG: caspase domain-containing protein [Gemmata sp.]
MRFAASLALVLVLAPLVGAQDPKAPAPRRLLFVHAGGYLYLNPLTTAAPGGTDRVRAAADRLAAGLRVPAAKDNDQLFVLTDHAPDAGPLPTKDAITKVLDGFCETTRPHDRVVIYFGAHVVPSDGKACLVPLDGNPDVPDTLIPVADIYAKLKSLKAAQKVVVWDACRYNPDRVRARRDPGPMTELLFADLTAVPTGVQALVSCSPGERSLEYFTPRGPAGTFAGSALLDALRQAAADGPKTGPGDPVPVDDIHKGAAKAVAAVAGTLGLKQTPALAGAAPKGASEYDPKAAPAKRFEWPAPPKGAPAADVKAVLAELALPPLIEDDSSIVERLTFHADALKGHAADVPPEEAMKNTDKYPLRVATLRALQAVRDAWPAGLREGKGITALSAPVTERGKKPYIDAQEPVALALVRLESELELLAAAVPHRAKETKRWQAHYDYALADLNLRLAVLNEYNLLLARVRTESLPDLPAGAPGWRLVPAPELKSRREVKALLTRAHEGFARVAAEHEDTPWAVLAKRSRAFTPGLQWEPVRAPK